MIERKRPCSLPSTVLHESPLLEYSRRKKPHALLELVYLKYKYRSNIIFVLETLTSTTNSNRILKALHFDNKIVIDPINHCGGIWICWNNANILVKNYITNERYGQLDVCYKPNNKDYSIIGSYCPAHRNR